jgi:hypothetical protein
VVPLPEVVEEVEEEEEGVEAVPVDSNRAELHTSGRMDVK